MNALAKSLLRRLPVFSWLLVGSLVHAAVIERDWLAPGDGLLTYDTVNQREWLDIPVTLLSQYGDTIDGAVEAALLELEPGGALEGFTHASADDVRELVASAGVVVSSYERTRKRQDKTRKRGQEKGDSKKKGTFYFFVMAECPLFLSGVYEPTSHESRWDYLCMMQQMHDAIDGRAANEPLAPTFSLRGPAFRWSAWVH